MAFEVVDLLLVGLDAQGSSGCDLQPRGHLLPRPKRLDLVELGYMRDLLHKSFLLNLVTE